LSQPASEYEREYEREYKYEGDDRSGRSIRKAAF
jgi:hypothetical protein